MSANTENPLLSLEQENTFTDMAEFFKVFGDFTRIRILWTLRSSELCVCDLAEKVNMSKSAVSHQLRILRYAKLVRDRRQGKHIFYALADDHVEQIMEKGFEHVTE